MEWLFPLHYALTLFMTGLVVFVHHVHYPLMAKVGKSAFLHYQEAHMRRTGHLAAPVMLLELASAGGLLYLSWYQTPSVHFTVLSFTNALLLLAIWGLTFAKNVPQHQKLAKGWDAAVHRSLLSMNRWRTLLWLLRSGLLTGIDISGF